MQASLHVTLVAVLLTAAGCAKSPPPALSRSEAAPSDAQCSLNAPPAGESGASPVALPVPHNEHALHNVYRVGPSPGLISGGVPEGDAGFDELQTMGIKTIISVDGAAPDVARAEARGLRYIHIPITYAEVSDDERTEISRAIRDFEPAGPIYIHCHHGKHRSPAATAAAAVSLGRITPEQGVAFMTSAGTAANYAGLYSSVAAAGPLAPGVIDAAPAEFPSIRHPRGIVGAMVEIDAAYDHLGLIKAAGWVTPADHPDLVPAAEAGRLADHMRFSGEDPETKSLGEDFAAKLRHAVEVASALEENIVRGRPAAELDSGYKLLQASCKDCHAAYRDRK